MTPLLVLFAGDPAGRRDRHRPRLRRGHEDARRLAPLAQGHRRPRRVDVARGRQRAGRARRRLAARPAARRVRQELRADAARRDRGRAADRRRSTILGRALFMPKLVARERHASSRRRRTKVTAVVHRRRPRPDPRRHVGRQRRADRPRADPRLPAHAAPRRRHRRLPRRDPAVGRRRSRTCVSGNVDFAADGRRSSSARCPACWIGTRAHRHGARRTRCGPRSAACCSASALGVLTKAGVDVPPAVLDRRAARRRPRSPGCCSAARRAAPSPTDVGGGARMTARLTHLQALESEAIHVMREVAAELSQAGAAVQRRQGLDRAAAPRREGVPARAASRSRSCTSTPATTSPR